MEFVRLMALSFRTGGDAAAKVMDPQSTLSERNSFLTTPILFALGGAITSIFSASLAALTTHASLTEILALGMFVPSFTWIVQLSASGLCFDSPRRRLYWRDLAWVCVLGSAVLLPAAILNLVMPAPQLWMAAANVLISVAAMAADLFRRSIRHGLPLGWPASWCATITLNMALFVWASRGWW